MTCARCGRRILAAEPLSEGGQDVHIHEHSGERACDDGLGQAEPA